MNRFEKLQVEVEAKITRLEGMAAHGPAFAKAAVKLTEEIVSDLEKIGGGVLASAANAFADIDRRLTKLETSR